MVKNNRREGDDYTIMTRVQVSARSRTYYASCNYRHSYSNFYNRSKVNNCKNASIPLYADMV